MSGPGVAGEAELQCVQLLLAVPCSPSRESSSRCACLRLGGHFCMQGQLIQLPAWRFGTALLQKRCCDKHCVGTCACAEV